MDFLKATLGNLKELNELIVESRSIWNYPEDYAAASLPLIMVNELYLNSSFSFEIRNSDLIGFLALVEKPEGALLDHLWIKKEYIGRGLGKVASRFVDQLAAENAWSKIMVYPDPPAEGFYLKQGYSDTSQRLPSRVSGGPIFSVFEKSYKMIR